MSITAADLRAGSLRWSARAWIDGEPVALAALPRRTLSQLRPRNTASLVCVDTPPAGGVPAYVDLVLEGVGSVRFFTGFTDSRSARSAAWRREANLVDRLGALNRSLPETIVWGNTSFPDAVMSLLTAAGITAADVDSIYDPGSAYELGANYPIELAATETLSRVLAELMDFGGTAIYVTPSGRIRVVDGPNIPAATSTTIYARGADLDLDEFGIADAAITIEGNEEIVSSFTATGPKRPDGAIPDGTYTATGISGKPASQNYRFAQTDATCVAIARREVGRRARARTNFSVEAPLNPLLAPGDSVLFRDAAIGFPTNTPAIVMEIATNGMMMTMQLSTGASLVDGFDSSIKPPVTDFSMTVENQLVTLAGVPVGAFLVQCQDLSRDTGGREITGLSWTASGTGASPTSSSDPAPIFLFTDLDGAEITLEATSSSGESATVTKTPVAGETQILSRIVSVAAGSSGWRVLATLDGWRSFSAPGGASCTAVPAFNEVGPLLSGWSSGAIYASADALAGTPTLVATLSGSIRALHVNEGDEQQLLAAVGSTLHRSADGGATWAEVFEFSAPITDAQSSPGNPNEIRVTAGEALWLSFDGATFSASATGITGSTAEALATAPWGRAAVFSDVGSALADAVKFEEAYTVTWAGVDLADQPTNGLTSITPLLDEPGFVVGTNNDLIRDGVLPALVLTAGAGSLYKLVWDGSQFVASLLPEAAGSGAGKLTGGALHNPIDDQSAQSIGYGPLAALPASPARLILLPYGAAGADDVIHVYDPATGTWSDVTPPQAGWQWLSLRAAPFAPNSWLLLGNSGGASSARKFDVASGVVKAAGTSDTPLYLSTDAGATWSPVALSHPFATNYTAGAFSEAGISGEGLAWDTETAGRWYLYGASDNLSVGNSRWVWRGSGATAATGAHEVGNTFGSLVSGAEGQAVITTNFPAASLRYWSASGGSTQPPGTGVGGLGYILAREPGPSRRVALTAGGTLYVSADYRAAQPTARPTGIIGDQVVWATHGIYRNGRASGGVAQLDADTGAATPLSPNSVLSGHLSVDAQTRTTIAWYDLAGNIYVYDGAAVTVVPISFASIADFVEVVGST